MISTKYFSYVFFASLGSYYIWAEIIRAENDVTISKESIEKDINFLKAQFHYHLTFNFFNFCYNRVRKFSVNAANSVEEFSNILRYVRRQTNLDFS